MNEFTFRRVEEKYMLTKEQYKEFFKLVGEYLERDEYYESKICSIYFDSQNNDLLYNSIEKPIFKEKIRLRSYGIPEDLFAPVYLEVKEKYKGVVGKRRTKLRLGDFYEFYDTGKCSDAQIMKELKYYFDLYELKPYVFIGYDRYCYRGINEENLRITFDYNLRYRFDNLRLERGDSGDKILDDNFYIMEVKTLDAMPLWLTKCLSKLKLYPTSYSKVGKVFESKVRSEVVC